MNSSTYFTHGFHPYPAKFAPQVINRFLSSYCKKGDTVLDPFCGSGTTLVECILRGMNSVGVDLNPIAAIISRAKSNHYSGVDIKHISDFVSHIQEKFDTGYLSKSTLLANDILLPDFPNRDHWFQDNVSRELAVLKKEIEKVAQRKIRDLLVCAFSKIIVKVSNQDSEVRYTAKQKNHLDNTVFLSFIETVKNYLNALKNNDFAPSGKSKVYNGNAINILKEIPPDYYDFVITSPPYINTFDYYLYHKQRMFWLGFDHKVVRDNEIGNHHKIDTKKFDVAKADYIFSMTQVINELSRVSKINSYFVMIIGDGIVKGKTIDMSKVIIEICEDSAYDVKNIESIALSEITKSFNKSFSNAVKKEHTIILKNNK